MCGIVGILQRDAGASPDRQFLAQMTASVAHRGPDGGGTHIDGPVGLGHRRLAILDIAGGRQPLVHEASGRSLVYNGEIYNFRELRAQVQAKTGISFETDCDTEVLLHIASTTDIGWIESLNGMFAFALWDSRSKTLMLGRDRLGIKPLYYVNLGDQFLFASEIRALLLHPKVRRAVNFERIPEYLAFRTLCGTDTMYAGIHQVPPGSVMLFNQAAFKSEIKRYWSEGLNKSISDYVDPSLSFEAQFETLLMDAVRFRLISDVPVGTYNSGGVDSSLITAMVRSRTAGEQLHTFSVGFEEKDYDESPYAQIVADRLGTCHHALTITAPEYLASYERAVTSIEEPINHAHSVQLLKLSEFAKQYVTVVLTGEGSDEVFGGYPRFHIPLVADHLSFMPKPVWNWALRFANLAGNRKAVKLLEAIDDSVGLVIENSRFTPRQALDLVCPGTNGFPERVALYEESQRRTETRLGLMLHFDQRTYLPSLLTRLDKTSMAAGIECRVPFLDYRIVEWSRLLPQQFKIKTGRENKVIVKAVARRWLPEEIITRKKVGFGVPVGTWLRNKSGLGRYLELLTDSTFRQRGYCNSTAVGRLVSEHLRAERDHSEILWGLINLEVWWRMFIDVPVAVPKSPLSSDRVDSLSHSPMATANWN